MPAHVLTVDELQEFIGETVYDPYGRVVGQLVSIDSDVDGTVISVAVEDDHREVFFIEADAIHIEGGRLIAWPQWRVKAHKVLASYRRALKRMKSLEEMYSRNEIPSTVYHEMKKRLDKNIERLKDEARKLKSMMTTRIHEIEDSNLKLDRAIANLKVSYMSGELSERAYKAAIERLRAAKESNTQELEDLKNTRNKLEALEAGTITPAEKPRHEEKPVAKQPAAPAAVSEEKAPSAPSVEGIQPIPVKLIEG